MAPILPSGRIVKRIELSACFDCGGFASGGIKGIQLL